MHVLAQLHQYEPVSKPEFLTDQGHIFSSTGLGPATEHQVPGLSEQENIRLEAFGSGKISHYLEKIVMSLKTKKTMVQLMRSTNQNQRKT